MNQLIHRNEMRRIIIVLSVAFSFCSLKVSAQFYNTGSIIKIQPGANIFTAGDFQNISGTLSNDGKLEVQGNFINAASYSSPTNDDSLILSGSGSITLTGGPATLTNLWINKTSNTDIIKLGGTTMVSGKLDYSSGNFTTDPLTNPAYLLSAPITAIFNFAAGKEITGRVQRTGWINGNTVIFNQPNMAVTTNGGTKPDDVTVTMIPQSEGGDPSQAEREVKRKFLFTQTGGSGFTADLVFGYADAELNNNAESNLIPWQLISSEWNSRISPVTKNTTSNFVATTGISAAEFNNEWKLADPKYTFNITAYLRGAWNSGTGQMNTVTGGINNLLPLNQPYNDPSFGNYNGGETVSPGFFAAHTNITDWILTDWRKPITGLPADADPSTYTGRKAAFILNNGTIVDLDGITPLPIDISKQGVGFILLRHRNHLSVMSNAIVSNAMGSFTNDFSQAANAYVNPSVVSSPLQVLPGTSPVKYGLWAGNANKDATVNAGDVGLVKANANAALSGYTGGDVNMDGTVNAGDVGITKVSANSSAQANNVTGSGQQSKSPGTVVHHN